MALTVTAVVAVGLVIVAVWYTRRSFWPSALAERSYPTLAQETPEDKISSLPWPACRDLLGFKPVAKNFADLLARDTGPLAIGIYGPWGSGKTSLLNMLFSNLPPDVTVRYIDLMDYERRADAWAGVVLTGLFALTEDSQSRVVRFYRRALVRRIILSGNLASPSTMSEFERVRAAVAVGETASLTNEMARQMRKRQDQARVIVFIDNLDRVRASHTVDCLEAVKLLLNGLPIQFVMAMDEIVIASSIESYFSDVRLNGHAYLEKLMSYTFRIPPLTKEALNRLVATGLRQFRLSDRLGSTLMALHPVEVPRRVVRIIEAIASRTPLLPGGSDEEAQVLLAKFVVIAEIAPAVAEAAMQNSAVLEMLEMAVLASEGPFGPKIIQTLSDAGVPVGRLADLLRSEPSLSKADVDHVARLYYSAGYLRQPAKVDQVLEVFRIPDLRSPVEKFVKARVSLEQGNILQAIGLLHAIVVDEKADEDDLLNAKLFSYRALEAHELELRLAEKGLRRFPGSKPLLVGKADALLRLTRLPEARQIIESVVAERGYGYQDAVISLFNAYVREKDFDLLLKATNEAIEANPKWAAAFRNKGLALGKLDRVEEAIAAFQKALQLDPKEDQAASWLADLYSKLKRDKDELAYRRLALERDPKDVDNYLRLAAALQRLSPRETAEIEKALSNAALLAPTGDDRPLRIWTSWLVAEGRVAEAAALGQRFELMRQQLMSGRELSLRPEIASRSDKTEIIPPQS